MQHVKIAVMLPGAQEFCDQNINKTWKAHVKTHDDTVVAYVKLTSPRELFVECICSILGRSIGLPIPEPIIVKITNDALSDIPVGTNAFGFASEDAGFPSLRRHLNTDEGLEKLAQFSKTVDIGVFDEWIANPDRHIGNILFDGGTQFSFIDHGLSINLDLDPSAPAATNIIIDSFFAGQSEFEKYKLNRSVQSSIIPQYNEIPLSIVSDKAYGTHYLSDEETAAIINFLDKRVSSLESLFASRLNLQQQEMAL